MASYEQERRNERARDLGFRNDYERRQWHETGGYQDYHMIIQDQNSTTDAGFSQEDMQIAADVAHDIHANVEEFMRDFIIYYSTDAADQGLTLREAVEDWTTIWDSPDAFDDWVAEHREDDTKPYYHFKRK